jgi:DNA-binding NarL/FixJ family response regulator
MPSMVGKLLRVLLVDDHEVIRHGIRALLGAHEDVIVVGEAESAPAAVAAANQHRPDVVVMDVRLSDGSGIEATREIRARHPETRVLMLTSFADHEALLSSIMAGASGYVLKQIRGNELVSAVRSVAMGQNLIDPALTGWVMERLRASAEPGGDDRLMRLSAQEERVLELVATGRTNREIGAELHLAEKTVRNYVSSILAKLEVARRAEAAVYLARRSARLGNL